MSEQQQRRVRFYRQVDIVPISPRKPSRPYSPSPTDDGSSSSESRSEATHCPSMEGTAGVDQTVNIPTPPGGGSLDRMAAMRNALIPTPPGTATAPHMDRMEAMRRATIPTPPADSPAPRMDRLVAMHNATIPPPPACTPPAQTDRIAAMRNAIPIPPSAVPAPNMDRLERMRNAAIPHPPSSPINNLERMRMVAIPTPPSTVPAPNMDRLERMRNAAIPLPPSSSMEMVDARPQPSSNIGYPQQSTSTEVADSQRQPCTITGEDINQGEEPDRGRTLDFGTPDRGQIRDLLLNAVADIMQEICLHQMSVKLWNRRDWLHQMRMTIFCVCFTRSNRGMVRASPPQISPTTQDLDGHIVQAMRRISADIRQLVRSRVQHVEAGQYTVDMIDLLEVSRHPHVGYSLEPYTGGPPYPSRQSAIEMAIVYLGCRIECAVIHLLGMPRPSDWPAEWYGNLRLDMEELDHLILVTISRESFSPLLPACYHAYLRCKEDQARFQDEVRQIPLGAFRMIDQISHFIPNWTPRSPNKYAGFVFPWWVDRSPQYHSDFQQMRGARIFPIAHEYFQHTWPLQRLSMGDRIDEWMEEKVSAYMITARSAAGRTYGVNMRGMRDYHQHNPPHVPTLTLA
ncbi:hypothetical protein EDD16DRAFT_1748941 [Pisolithus croceorrhizus]|nr:hypothetical protein EDD16DRAFT_1748941 [Pisolithus croceorrhizus]